MSRLFVRTSAVVATLTLVACGGDSKTAAATTDSASTALVIGAADIVAAQQANIGSGITLSGPLQPRDAVVLRAQVNGTITGLRVNRGSAVSNGQRLATLRAAGVVSVAAGARAGVAAAEANLALARKQLEAARTLNKAGAMSELDKQSAEAQYESAVAQVAAAKAQSTGADEAAGFTAINAPFRGVVSKRWRQDGESVKSGDEVLTVVDSRVLELSGQIGVADAGRIRTGQQVAFVLDAFPGETFKGRVARTDPVADEGTRQVGVYVELDNSKGRIVGGQYARGRVELGASSAVVIPATAVQGASANGTGGHVFILANDQLTKRDVSIGNRDELTGMVAVLSGVQVGDRVLRAPTAAIINGTRVRLANADQPAATTSPSPDSSATPPKAKE
ncbi:MAG: efflux RND transporter periplasmic adaptor subunit [Gemmatimonadaceae bacterium]|nr:efflux RND transporter periplasmic adaptor subunit [Gemmatimonadaceae bacterium]